MGITSVSYAGSTLVGGGMEKAEERRETRVLRLLPDLPTTFCLRGDLRGDFVTSGRWAAKPGEGGTPGGNASGAGVGGCSESICWTCHDRLSSKNLILSL